MPTDKVNPVHKAVTEQLVPDLVAKTFASGKEGFFSQAKVTIDGKRYQAQIMLVEIQPK